MFKGHPKALIILALSNMGERFGFYTMLSIFALYLQAKFGLTASKTSLIYGIFIAMVYFLPLFGGILADKVWGYGRTILIGIIVMFFGYLLLAVPGKPDFTGYTMMFIALALIGIGTGCFKGNLQVLAGNLYDDPKYSAKRDVAFSIFYMFINIGAFFAPSAAEYVSNTMLAKDGFRYEAKVPDLSFKYLNYKVVDSVVFRNNTFSKFEAKGKTVKDPEKVLLKAKYKQSVLFKHDSISISNELTSIAKSQLGNNFTSTKDFAHSYIKSLSKSYNWGFGVACLSMILSLLIYVGFRKEYKHADKSEKQKAKEKVTSTLAELTPHQIRERLIALGMVFLVVIFFWMSFQQNGLCMTFFARDYTMLKIGPLENIGFSLLSLIPMILGFYGVLMIIQNKDRKKKLLGGLFALAVIVWVIYYYHFTIHNDVEFLKKGYFSITPPRFQQFNPMFIVLLTPIFVAFFSWLNNKKKEPSAPRKIAIGMLIAAIAFSILIFGSFGLQSPSELAGGVSPALVSPNWLISTYFMLTIAEIFISPMGISFVSKVAPPKMKGAMMGAWFAASAIGNYLVGVMGSFWDKMSLPMFWTVLVCSCMVSAIVIFAVLKRLERVTT